VKERLTGAIILVALIVLLVPALLTGPIRSAPRPLAAASPLSAEEPPLRSYTIQLADDARARTARSSGPEQPAPVGAAAVPAPEPAPAPAPTPAILPATPSVSTPASVAAAAPAASSSASPQSGAWMVQLGSFASRANAERLAQQLRARGFQVNVSRGSAGRRLYRVRAGPAPTHAAATQLAAKLNAAGHAGAIVPR
jgi:DedD protein